VANALRVAITALFGHLTYIIAIQKKKTSVSPSEG